LVFVIEADAGAPRPLKVYSVIVDPAMRARSWPSAAIWFSFVG